MINYENEGKEVKNIKTGTTATVICQYNRTTDGSAMVEVLTCKMTKSYWQASHVAFN